MSRKIVGLIRPFDVKQNFYVYEDGNKLGDTTATIDTLNDTIFSLADKYNVTKVDLVGPKQYIRGLSKKFQEAEIAKYNENKIEINIV
jgi:hypothetical protein